MTATTERQRTPTTSGLDETNPLVRATVERTEELVRQINHGEATTAELARLGFLVACLENNNPFDFYRPECPAEQPTPTDSHPDTLEIWVI